MSCRSNIIICKKQSMLHANSNLLLFKSVYIQFSIVIWLNINTFRYFWIVFGYSMFITIRQIRIRIDICGFEITNAVLNFQYLPFQLYNTFLNGRVSIIHQSNACTVQSVTELIHQYWGDRLDISLLWKRSSAFQCIKKFKTVLSSDFSYIAMLEVFNAIWPNWYVVAFFINIFWHKNFSFCQRII